MVSEERLVPVEDGPPPQDRKMSSATARGLKWVGGTVGFLATVVGLILSVKALLAQGDEQIRTLARIEARLQSDAEDDKKRDAQIDALTQGAHKHEVYSERSFATLFAALAKEGYQPPRGAPKQTAQIDWQPTKNAKKPLRPVEADGSELALPDR